MKSNKGITLIVLVITIIVLLVLAGVAIASLTGSNNMINRAQQAKTSSEESKENEEAKLGEYETKIIETAGGGGSLSMSDLPVTVGTKYYFDMDGHVAYFQLTSSGLIINCDDWGGVVDTISESEFGAVKAKISSFDGGKYSSTTAASTFGNDDVYFCSIRGDTGVIITEAGGVYLMDKHTGENDELVDMSVRECTTTPPTE